MSVFFHAILQARRKIRAGRKLNANHRLMWKPHVAKDNRNFFGKIYNKLKKAPY